MALGAFSVRYLRAFENWEGSFNTLRQFVEAQSLGAAERGRVGTVLSLILGAAVLFGSDSGIADDEIEEDDET